MRTQKFALLIHLFFAALACGKKIEVPERGSATLSDTQKAKENSENLKELKHYSVSYTYQALTLNGSAEMKIYTDKDTAKQAFIKDIPQRPLADISRNDKRAVLTRNAIWLLKENTFTYYFFFAPGKDWESLADHLKSQYSNGIKEFAEGLVNK